MYIAKTGPDSTFLEKILITEQPNRSNGSWITVIVGENGTKKSLLLRNIAEDILRPGRKKNNLQVEGEISKLITLSGTPLDRFPRLNNRFNSIFSYFGLRASNNVAGTGHSEKSLIVALISNRNKLKKRAPQLQMVFGQLGLKPIVRASFQISRRFALYRNLHDAYEGFKEKMAIEFIKYCEYSLANPILNSQSKRDYNAALKFVRSDEGEKSLQVVTVDLFKNAGGITVSTSGNYVKKDTFPIAIWRVLLESGIIDLRKTWFEPSEDSLTEWGVENIPGDYLSSGQWSWLCTLGGLAVEVENDSAILIDEPENSLHPAWQRDYIPAIISIVGDLAGCHVILATHSPLIASGLPIASGNVRRLLRQKKDGVSTITSVEAPNTFGWSASDAYEALFQLETTRAKIFNANATKALEMIKDKSGTESERTEVAVALRTHCDSLPVLDPMRHAMERVAASLERKFTDSQKN
jgi:predicted ATPase